MRTVSKLTLAAAATALAAVFSAPAHAQLQDAISVTQQTAQDAAQSQERVNQLDTQTTVIENEYRSTLKQLERLQRYNSSLRRQIRGQEIEMETLREQIDNVAGLSRNVVPMMENMLDALGEFVEADLPFQIEERRERIQRLRELMDLAAASPADKYRAIVEAYEIESEYGRTIAAYDGFVTGDDGVERKVDMLQIGRVALIYQTLDGDEMYIFDRDANDWTPLSGSFRDDVSLAVRMAKELVPPDLLTIPVPAPSQAAAQ